MTPDDVKFFWDQAGYSWTPGKETQEAGRHRCSLELAEAEANARRLGYSFDWDVDDARGSLEWTKARPAWATWGCRCFDSDGKVVASLGAVDFGRDGEPWGNPYRRVVEAELAVEALAQEVPA